MFIIIHSNDNKIIFFSCCVRRKQTKQQKLNVLSSEAKPSLDMVPMATLKQLETENGPDLTEQSENVACKLPSIEL